MTGEPKGEANRPARQDRELREPTHSVPSEDNSEQPRFTGRHMLYVMLAFFITILTVNMTMVYFSRSSWTGLVVKNSYVASQKFNHRVKAQETLMAAGWHAKLDEIEGRVIFLVSRTGLTVPRCDVRLDVTRPMGESEDQHINLIAVKGLNGEAVAGNGPDRKSQTAYGLPKTLLSGRWDLVFHADCAEAPGVIERGYRLRDGRQLSFRSAFYQVEDE